MLRLILSCALLIACGDDGAPPASRCAAPTDCLTGDRCVNGFCVPAGTDAAIDTASPDSAVDSAVDSDVIVLDSAMADTGADADGGCSTDAECTGGARCMAGACTVFCPDLAGTYSFCDGGDCPSGVCYVGEVVITAMSLTECSFSAVTTGGGPSMNGSFDVGSDGTLVFHDSFSIRRDIGGDPDSCLAGMVGEVGGAIVFNFNCDFCALLLAAR